LLTESARQALINSAHHNINGLRAKLSKKRIISVSFIVNHRQRILKRRHHLSQRYQSVYFYNYSYNKYKQFNNYLMFEIFIPMNDTTIAFTRRRKLCIPQ